MAKVIGLRKYWHEEIALDLQTLLDALPYYVIVIDSSHKILLANKAIQTSLGVEPEKIIGAYCPKAVHGMDKPFPGCPLAEAMKKNQPVEKDLYDERYNVWVKSTVYPTTIHTLEGKQVFFHTAFDITERKKTQAELQFKSSLLERATDSIFVHDFRGNMIYVNEAAYKTRGYTQEELLAMPLQKLDVPKFVKLIKPRIDKLMTAGHASFESAHYRKDGSIMPVEVHARIIELREKKAVASIVRDMTEHKKADKELHEAQQELEKRVKERTAELTKSNILLEKEIGEHKKVDKELMQSLKKLQATLKGTVHVLASIVETRDSYTAGHQKRVAELACAIGNEMGLSNEAVEGINVAGTLHDIGKIFIPAEILNKPSVISDLEFSLIKTHPQIGYEILQGIDFPWPVADIVWQHHERINGSGYPFKLPGEKIMLEAKILAVADVVEAMSSHRPYRPALGLQKALEEISHNKGVLYDSEIVDVCLKLFADKKFKF